MEEIIYLNYVSLEHYQELIKLNLSRHGYRILKNVTKPRNKNLWVEKLSDKYIHLTVKCDNKTKKSHFKIEWKTYLIVISNQNLN
jgi:hypothetical protein